MRNIFLIVILALICSCIFEKKISTKTYYWGTPTLSNYNYIKLFANGQFEIGSSYGFTSTNSSGTYITNGDTLVLNTNFQKGQNDLNVKEYFNEISSDSSYLIIKDYIINSSIYNVQKRTSSLIINDSIIIPFKDILSDTICFHFKIKSILLEGYLVCLQFYSERSIPSDLNKYLTYKVINERNNSFIITLDKPSNAQYYPILNNKKFIFNKRKKEFIDPANPKCKYQLNNKRLVFVQ